MRIAIDKSKTPAAGRSGGARAQNPPVPSIAFEGQAGEPPDASALRTEPPSDLLALQRIIAGRPSPAPLAISGVIVQRAPSPPGQVPGAAPEDRLPFESPELGKGGWDAAAILKSTSIEPGSAMGAAIAQGPNAVLALDRQLAERVDAALSKAGDASYRLQAALGQIWVRTQRVSIAIILHKATHGDLIAMGAMEKILSMSTVEQVPRLVDWCLALEKGDFAAVAATSRVSALSAWSSDYDDRKSFLKKPYEEFKAGLGEIRATTKGGLTENKGRPIHPIQGRGTPAAPEITFDVLKEIYPGLAKDVAQDPAKETKARGYCASLNLAFKVMQIDTVEAQADYLAHAFVESDQFRQFTETQGFKDVAGTGTQKWVDDPAVLELDMTNLNATYNDVSTKESRERKASVNPHGNYEFIGRGPVQVTHQAEYVEVIAMLEKAAEQYERAAGGGNLKLSEYAALAREAADAIKADPRQAARPKYAFLVSAAFMKKRGVDVSVGWAQPGVQWTGNDIASGWVAGGKQKAGSPQAKALRDKSAAYDRIHRVLLREAKKLAVK
jgi:hypothetical protein